MIGIIFALAAAFSWGAGDFCGGLATRKNHQFQVLLLATASSLSVLFVGAIFLDEGFPAMGDIIIAVIAGLSGALGLAALYRGLSLGNSALVAPVAGVIGAIIPTLVGLFVEGLPSLLVMGGYVLSLAGIWMLSRSEQKNGPTAPLGLGLALLAGVGFGGFLTLIAQMEGEQVFTPLVFSKIASLILALLLVRLRQLNIPKLNDFPYAILSGFLDAGGNILYLFSTQFIRLDIAALLSSLYPAGTVLLSGLVLKERFSLGQWIGVGTCLAGIMLITAG